MGRKPNPVIMEHFARGAKLNDSSNRYEHTCKLCGENFPKGRIDSLTTHILVKCRGISKMDQERARIGLSNKNDGHIHMHGHQGQIQMNGITRDLPMNPAPQWNGLQTLAEAARHSDLTENHPPPEHGLGGNGPLESTRLGNGIQIQEHFTQANPPVSYEKRISRVKKAGGQKMGQRNSDLGFPHSSGGQLIMSRQGSPNLAMAATSMAQAQAAASFMPDMLDPQLLAEPQEQHEAPQKSMEENLNEANATMPNFFPDLSNEQQGDWPMPVLDDSNGSIYQGHDHAEAADQALSNVDPQQPNGYARIAMNPSMPSRFSHESGNGQKNSKPKPRARFEKERRKEVQQIRKMGACIRCRMLKKTCSSGTPCKPCSNVESARVWKQGCIRTRLGTDLDMFSSNLHFTLALNDVNQLKTQIHFQPSSTHRLDVSHFPESMIFAILDTQEGFQAQGAGNLDPGSSGEYNTRTIRIIDNSKADCQTSIETYTKKMLDIFIENEISDFMKVTLKTARDESLKTDEPLMKRVLEFWGLCHILYDSELQWTMSERPVNGHVGPIMLPRSSQAFNIISSQLNAAVEKRAANLCKIILSDIERRLLLKASNQSFELYIANMIILNCFERATWLFKIWEIDSFKNGWPLADTQEHFVQNAEKVAELLHSLLRIRHIPPEVFQDESGFLASSKSPESISYFKQLSLSFAHVQDKQANPKFEDAHSRCYEFRFCSKLLLPST